MRDSIADFDAKVNVLQRKLHPLDISLELCNFNAQANALDTIQAFFRIPFFKFTSLNAWSLCAILRK